MPDDVSSDATKSLNSTPHSAPVSIQEIGPYRILELLGEGGMGEVYKAERRHPMRQTVAIKIIKLGYGTREVITRFESERQALARMDHPSVARVFDAGTTETGRPYFVMEYVPGVPITKFADDNKLSIKDRLQLFTQACEAITHAHTKAIIHRDIKASNILAYVHDGKPTVKVIDFGIAKALTGDRLTDQTFNTSHGQVIGTYESMSPEQADGSPDIDTRTDVYSLGVLLYELLSGSQPFDRDTLAHAADQEIRRIIREVEPPRPSTRLSNLGESATKVAADRQAKVEALSRELRSELEWIPLKAMRKERDRRYASPLQMSQDIGNYLAGLPLIAAPESRLYRMKKRIARHRGAIAAIAGLAIVVTGATVAYVHGIRSEQLKTKSALASAQSAQRTSDAVNQFLKEMLQSANPLVAQGKQVLVRDVIDQAQKNADSQLKDQPLVLASVLSTLAATYSGLGESNRALELAQRAQKIYETTNPPGDKSTIDTAVLLGDIEFQLGRFEDAEKVERKASDSAKKYLGANDRQTLMAMTMLGLALQEQGKFAESEPVLREVLDRRRQTFGESDVDTLNAMHNLAYSLAAQSRPADAEPIARQALEARTRILGEMHPDTIASLQVLGTQLEMLGRFSEAEPLFKQFLERSTKVYGEKHQQTIAALGELGRLQFRMGNTSAALENLQAALKFSREAQGDDHPATLQLINDVAFVLLNTDHVAQAEPLFREALDRRTRALGAEHPATLQSVGNLAGLLFKLGPAHYDEAIRLAQQALDANRRAYGPKHVVVLGGMNSLCNMLAAAGQFDRAIPLARELFELAPQTQLAPADRARYMAVYGLTLVKAGHPDEAIDPLIAAEKELSLLKDPGSVKNELSVLDALVRATDKRGDEADKWRQKLTALRATTNPTTQR